MKPVWIGTRNVLCILSVNIAKCAHVNVQMAVHGPSKYLNFLFLNQNLCLEYSSEPPP